MRESGRENQRRQRVHTYHAGDVAFRVGRFVIQRLESDEKGRNVAERAGPELLSPLSDAIFHLVGETCEIQSQIE